uniref:RHS repeat-associated core domain-containing protein n=1 Tax=Pseudomonas sp. RIT-PI-S TaxID=3035295 RepID=UPI0021D93153
PHNPSHRRYQYDAAGELIRTLDKLRGEVRYEYEANGQLHRRDTGRLADNEVFRYDPAANRLNFNNRQFDHVKDNRLKTWQDQEYRYDAWGNLVEKSVGVGKLQTFSYDCENCLVRAETWVNGKRESTGSYRYDSLGRRVAKQAERQGHTEYKSFLWQGLRMLREERPGSSSLYVYEPASYAPLARIDQAEGEEQKLYYFHTDQIGTPLEMTDAAGDIVWQATYRAWGSVEDLTVNGVEQNLRFQGQYFDAETGLHYNTFRYYDPEVGRFVTQDPIGLLGGDNLYRYAPNTFSWTDALGLASSNPGVYDVFFEARLPTQEMYKLSDPVHFSESNRQLHYAMKNDEVLRSRLEGKYPGIEAHVSPTTKGTFRGKAFPGTTWHHHGQVGGLLQLVDMKDHKSRHLDYHAKGVGGRKRWGGGGPCR